MDWIRRNWPDLLIGVALVAVIAMIVATLLSGGSLPSLLRRNTAPEVSITNTTVDPETPQTPEATGTSSQATAGTAANGDANSGSAAQGEEFDVFVPGTPGAPDTAAQNDGAATGTAGQDTTTQTTAAQSEAAQSSSTPEANGAASVNAPLPESVINGGFRVAAGAVDSRDSALAAAQTFRDAGYTVTVEPQGNLYLLWIGPYASDAGAERVVARLKADGLVPDALVYTYDPTENAVTAGSAGANGAAGNAANADAANTGVTNTGTANTGAGTATGTGSNAATNTASNPAAGSAGTTGEAAASATENTSAATEAGLTPPAGESFLQVGAYRSESSAQPQREQLEQLGLAVTSDEDDNGIVRLYVGPFAGAQLAQTQNRLSSQGIDSFPVTP